MRATTWPSVTMSPTLTARSVMRPFDRALTSNTPPLLTSIPEHGTSCATLPRKPQSTAVARTMPRAVRMIQPRASVTCMSWSSCSGDERRSSETLRKTFIGASPRDGRVLPSWRRHQVSHRHPEGVWIAFDEPAALEAQDRDGDGVVALALDVREQCAGQRVLGLDQIKEGGAAQLEPSLDRLYAGLEQADRLRRLAHRCLGVSHCLEAHHHAGRDAPADVVASEVALVVDGAALHHLAAGGRARQRDVQAELDERIEARLALV